MSGYVNKLGSLLRSQMQKVSDYNNTDNSALGKITAGKGLQIDGLNYTIPNGEYLVCKSCYEDLSAGKRVLVNMCGNEPVVVDIIA